MNEITRQLFICIPTRLMGPSHKLPSANTGLISLIARLVKIMNDLIDSQKEPPKGKILNVHGWSMSFLFLF